MRALRQKYSQKFVGPTEDIFRHASIDWDKDSHDVPVENFLNAQCQCVLSGLSLPLT